MQIRKLEPRRTRDWRWLMRNQADVVNVCMVQRSGVHQSQSRRVNPQGRVLPTDSDCLVDFIECHVGMRCGIRGANLVDPLFEWEATQFLSTLVLND